MQEIIEKFEKIILDNIIITENDFVSYQKGVEKNG